MARTTLANLVARGTLQHAGTAVDNTQRLAEARKVAARLKLAVKKDVADNKRDMEPAQVPSGGRDATWNERTEAEERAAAGRLRGQRPARRRSESAAAAAAEPLAALVVDNLESEAARTHADRVAALCSDLREDAPQDPHDGHPAIIGNGVALWEMNFKFVPGSIEPPVVSVRGEAVRADVVKSAPTVENTQELRPGDVVWVTYRGGAAVALVETVTLVLIKSADGTSTVGEERQYSASTPRPRAARGRIDEEVLDLDRVLLLGDAHRTRRVVDGVDKTTITEQELTEAEADMPGDCTADVGEAVEMLRTLGTQADSITTIDRDRASQNGRATLVVLTNCGSTVAAQLTLHDAPSVSARPSDAPITDLTGDTCRVRVFRRLDPRVAMENAPRASPAALRRCRPFAIVEAVFRKRLGCAPATASDVSTQQFSDAAQLRNWSEPISCSRVASKIRLHPSPQKVAELVASQTLTREAALDDPTTAARVILEELSTSTLTHKEHSAMWALDVALGGNGRGAAYTVSTEAVDSHTRRWFDGVSKFEPVDAYDAPHDRTKLKNCSLNGDARIVLFEVMYADGPRIERAAVLRGVFPSSVRDDYVRPRFESNIETADADNVSLATVRCDLAPLPRDTALSLSLSLSLSPSLHHSLTPSLPLSFSPSLSLPLLSFSRARLRTNRSTCAAALRSARATARKSVRAGYVRHRDRCMQTNADYVSAAGVWPSSPDARRDRRGVLRRRLGQGACSLAKENDTSKLEAYAAQRHGARPGQRGVDCGDAGAACDA